MEQDEEVAVNIIKDWRQRGVMVFEGVFLPPKTMVVSKDLMEHFRRIESLDKKVRP